MSSRNINLKLTNAVYVTLVLEACWAMFSTLCFPNCSWHHWCVLESCRVLQKASGEAFWMSESSDSSVSIKLWHFSSRPVLSLDVVVMARISNCCFWWWLWLAEVFSFWVLAALLEKVVFYCITALSSNLYSFAVPASFLSFWCWQL